MKTTSLRTSLFLAGLFAALFGTAAQAASSPTGVELVTAAFEEVLVTDKNGKQTKKLQPLTRTVPGKEVIYVITYRNKGAKAADNVVVNNPLPAGLLFEAGSATGDGVRSEVSVDGGKTYGALEKLTVFAAGKSRPAQPADVSHIRWVVLAPVKPGNEGKVTYRARVK